MSTKSANDRWAGRFADLRAWLEAHGRLPRRTRDASVHEYSLSSWVADQRTRHASGLLPDRHVQALRDAGVILEVDTLTPRQEELKVWVASHGRRPRALSADPTEASLGTLVYSLRSYALRGRLKTGTVELLLAVPDALTAVEKELVLSRLAGKLERRRLRTSVVVANLDPLDAKWERGFTDLSNWVKEHGSLPNRRSTDTVEYRIANWLNVQRMQARKDNLLPDYAARLQAIPGALEPRRPISDLGYANSIAAFHAKHGRMPLNRGTIASERTLAVTALRLRRKIQEGTIGKDALKVLSSVPGAAEPLSVRKSPHQRLADLEDLIKTTGRFPTSGHEGLPQWAYRALNGKASRNPKVASEIQQAVEKLRASTRRGQVATEEVKAA